MLFLTSMIRFASIIGLLAVCVLCIAPEVYAAQFQPMVGVPGLDTSGSYTFFGLINRLYIFLIAIGAVIGVIKIALAGVKWATSASGGSISAAKEDIKGVLLGLIILMVPYIVLSIINPRFANLDVLKLKPLSLPAAQSQSTGQSTGSGNSNGGGFTPVASRACGSCVAATGDGKCIAFENACVAAGGTANPVKEGNNYKSTCMVPQSITPCPNLPNP